MSELITACPFCNRLKHLYLNQVKGVYHCHRCKASGPITDDFLDSLGLERTITKVKAKDISLGRTESLSKMKHPRLWDYAKKRKALSFSQYLIYSPDYPNYLVICIPQPNGKNFYLGREPVFLYLVFSAEIL